MWVGFVAPLRVGLPGPSPGVGWRLAAGGWRGQSQPAQGMSTRLERPARNRPQYQWVLAYGRPGPLQINVAGNRIELILGFHWVAEIIAGLSSLHGLTRVYGLEFRATLDDHNLLQYL